VEFESKLSFIGEVDSTAVPQNHKTLDVDSTIFDNIVL
jgi:hypothetical protein